MPITVPEEYLRYLRGGQRKARGPRDDNDTGIEFVMRTLGKRSEVRDVPEVPDEDMSAEEDAVDPEDTVDDSAQDDLSFDRMVDPSLMTTAQLKAVFGSHAADVTGIFFQHSARITAPARFMNRVDALHLRLKERSALTRYRKGQVDPSVYIAALSSALASSNVALASNETLVVLTGGTPEAVVAGIVLGFTKVFVVAEDIEHVMLQMPSEEVERERKIDYETSPPPRSPTRRRAQPTPNPSDPPSPRISTSLLRPGIPRRTATTLSRVCWRPRRCGCWRRTWRTTSTTRQTRSRLVANEGWRSA